MRTPLSSIRPAAPPDPAGAYPTVAFAGVVLIMLGLILLQVGGWPLSPVTWYLARASGLTLYLLLWLAAVTGLGLTTKLLDRCGGRGVVYSVHGYATRLGLALLALHVMSLAADETVRFGLRQLAVPFAAPSREPWTGLGVIAAYLGLLIGISFGLRRLTGYRAWRALHWLTFALFVLALLHGIGAGSDTRAPWGIALYAVTGGTVFAMSWYRLLRWGQRAARSVRAGRPPRDRLAGIRPAAARGEPPRNPTRD